MEGIVQLISSEGLALKLNHRETTDGAQVLERGGGADATFFEAKV